jgi:hypothetical protein
MNGHTMGTLGTNSSLFNNFLKKSNQNKFWGGLLRGPNYEHWERIITSMKSIMGLSSMASLGTLVKIRELHLGLSWERNWKQQQNQWKQT